jgi:hypothetical protein
MFAGAAICLWSCSRLRLDLARWKLPGVCEPENFISKTYASSSVKSIAISRYHDFIVQSVLNCCMVHKSKTKVFGNTIPLWEQDTESKKMVLRLTMRAWHRQNEKSLFEQ